ncbi:hypothetical protein, partial [Bacteroides heparinolyticus]|uniref:hypothetical protein n=1 Tax=Prevotella heparinolytica TaxID=28113 RepID=UPI0035A16638
MNAFTITIKCIKEFSEDKVIEMKACRKVGEGVQRTLAGMISVWANDGFRQKEKKVVFIKIITKISSVSTPQVPEVDAEKDFGDFIANGQVNSTKTREGRSLISYLKQNLEKQYEGKYGGHFKAFYFVEDGYNPNDGSLTAGFSSLGADYVVVFKCKNEQTAAHEFLHSMNLP